MNGTGALNTPDEMGKSYSCGRRRCLYMLTPAGLGLLRWNRVCVEVEGRRYAGDPRGDVRAQLRELHGARHRLSQQGGVAFGAGDQFLEYGDEYNNLYTRFGIPRLAHRLLHFLPIRLPSRFVFHHTFKLNTSADEVRAMCDVNYLGHA
eukprot:5389089-Pyramimonas_sp.AAC.1